MASLTVFRLSLLFFFLMLVFPASYQSARGVLLVILFVCAVFSRRFIINNTILSLGILCVSTSILFIIYGALNNAPGAFNVGTVYVLWPVVYIVFLGALAEPECYTAYAKVIVVATMVINIVSAIVLGEEYGVLGSSVSAIFEQQNLSVGIMDEGTRFFLGNTTTLVFSIPFIFALLVPPPKYSIFNKQWRTVSTIALVGAVSVVFLSGRRAIYLVVLLAPFVTLLAFRMAHWNRYFSFTRINQLLGLMFVAAISVYFGFGFNFESLYEDFQEGFIFDASAAGRSSGSRGDQFSILIDGWLENPIFGHGHGSGSPLVVRDTDMPWAYELSFVALLYQVGLVGFFIYGCSLLWVFVRSWRIIRLGPQTGALMLPALLGLIFFLGATLTNPYLLKFDYLWVIFFPIALLNSYLVNQIAMSEPDADRPRIGY